MAKPPDKQPAKPPVVGAGSAADHGVHIGSNVQIGNNVVIGSNTGSERAPAWALNLRSNPDATVQIGSEQRRVRARVVEGAEREGLWRQMNDGYGGFDDYRARTSRDIMVFVLE